MEDNVKEGCKAHGCTSANVEELQSKLEEQSKELEDQKLLVEAYRKEAEQYKSWWYKETTKIKRMKEDVDDIRKLTKKLIERW